MKGKVYLIGAGPGEPELLTLKARKMLKDADTVVFDRLADRKILDFVRSGTELIDVGKTPGYHPVSQGRINEILVERARQGKNVVRLKGGDPFVFGRGGEEALFLAREGIPFEVIPGITSAISVPAYAGIPVTYRDICSSFHVFSGHEGPGKTNDFDWDTISRLKGTLVFLMGVKNMDLIVRSLMEHGKSPETPAAVIMEGTGAGQKTVVGTLSNIFRKSRDEGIENPAVIVIGDVVKLRQELCWFEKKKLFGKRILITGIADSGLNLEATKNINGENDIIEPRERNGLNQLIEEGVDVVFCPTIKINLVSEFIDEILDTLPLFDLLVFTSKNGVESFRQALRRKKYDIRRLRDIRLAVVGIRTGEELEKCFLYPDMMPTDYTSQALLERLKKENNIRNVALITSDIGGEKLEEGLKNLGVRTEKVIAFQNKPNFSIRKCLQDELKKGFDFVIFSSPSTFHFLREITGESLERIRGSFIVAIGPTTAQAIENEGFRVDMVPEEHTFNGIVRYLLSREGGDC